MQSTRRKLKLFLYLGRFSSAGGGMWSYALSICSALLPKLEDRLGPNAEITVAFGGPASLSAELETELRSSACQFLRLPSDFWPREIQLFLDLFRTPGRCDLLHAFSNLLPICRPPKASVLTVHDLFQAFPPTPIVSPKELLRSVLFRSAFALTIPRANSLLTVHPLGRAELSRRYPRAAAADVVYPPLQRPFLEAAPDRNGEEPPYVLAFASRDARKNLAGTIEGFAGCRAARELELRLLTPDPRAAAQVSLVSRSQQCHSRIRLLARVPAGQLPKLYAQASAVLFPSFAEGFGYPIYEALSQGTAVVCRDELIIPETPAAARKLIFGCTPADSRSISAALEAALTAEPGPAIRADAADWARSALDPSSAAEKVLAVYCKLLEDHQ